MGRFDPLGVHNRVAYGLAGVCVIGVGHVDQAITGLNGRRVAEGDACLIAGLDLATDLPCFAFVV